MYGGEECTEGFGGATWGKRDLGRPRRRWEHDIKLYLRGAMEWIDLAQNRDRWRFCESSNEFSVSVKMRRIF